MFPAPFAGVTVVAFLAARWRGGDLTQLRQWGLAAGSVWQSLGRGRTGAAHELDKSLGACYALLQHVALARVAGVSEARIQAVQQRVLDGELLSAEEFLALEVTDALLQNPRIPNSVFARLQVRFSVREIVEPLLLVGWYRAIGGLMGTLELDPELDPVALAEQSLAMLHDRAARP